MGRYPAGELDVLDILSCVDESTGVQLALRTEGGELRLHVDSRLLQTLRAQLDFGHQVSGDQSPQDGDETPAVLRFLASTCSATSAGQGQPTPVCVGQCCGASSPDNSALKPTALTAVRN